MLVAIVRALPTLFFFATHALADSVIVEDADYVHLTELPSGAVHLKSYRATDEIIEAYGRDAALDHPFQMDNPKAPECTRAEIHALKDWTGQSTYWFVNKTLREIKKGRVDGKTIKPQMERLILMIASAINCAPQWQGEVVRGERTPDEVLTEYQPGNYVLMRALTSTTKGTSIADTVPWVSRILIRNARGADIDRLGIAKWPEEKEVLIRPGTVFKVLRREAISEFPPRWFFNFEQY